MRKITVALAFLVIPVGLLLAQVEHADIQMRVKDSATSALNSYFSFIESGSILDLVEGVSHSAKTEAYLELIQEGTDEVEAEKMNGIVNGFGRLCGDIALDFASDPEIVRNDPGFATFLTIMKVWTEDQFGELPGLRY